MAPLLPEVYEQLENAPPKEKREMVLQLIEEHPGHRLELPVVDGYWAHLAGIDLSRHTRSEIVAGREDVPAWWEADLQGATLPEVERTC
jgi:hypothetical protein